MHRSLLTAALLCTFGVAGGLNLGCNTKTEGEKTLESAERHEEAGVMITRGERLVQDGEALEARGEALKRQGDDLKGDQFIAEGRAKKAQGRELIDEGRKIKP